VRGCGPGGGPPACRRGPGPRRGSGAGRRAGGQLQHLQHQVVPAGGHVPGEAAEQGVEVRGHQAGTQLVQEVAGQIGVLLLQAVVCHVGHHHPQAAALVWAELCCMLSSTIFSITSCSSGETSFLATMVERSTQIHIHPSPDSDPASIWA
jgi:hypothetical protein